MTAPDPITMIEALKSFPEQCDEAWQQALAHTDAIVSDPRWPESSIRRIVVAGMGGSGIGGRCLEALSAPWSPLPVTVIHGYSLPAFVDESTLVVTVSYSGSTTETMSVFRQAVERAGAVVAVTSGGRMGVSAATERSGGRAVFRIPVPEGYAPRAAFGHLFLPQWVLLHRVAGEGISPAQGRELADHLAQLRDRWRPDAGLSGGLPATLAAQLLPAVETGSPVLIYGLGDLGGAAAYRWQTQLNENAKAIVHSHYLPELHHNEIVGWQEHDSAQVVVLRHDAAKEETARRAALTADLLRDRAAVSQVEGAGASPLTQLFHLIYVGDVVSVLLARRRGVDPRDIAYIDKIKASLRESDPRGGKSGHDGE